MTFENITKVVPEWLRCLAVPSFHAASICWLESRLDEACFQVCWTRNQGEITVMASCLTGASIAQMQHETANPGQGMGSL